MFLIKPVLRKWLSNADINKLMYNRAQNDCCYIWLFYHAQIWAL